MTGDVTSLQKTSRLLQSARKIIDEARSPAPCNKSTQVQPQPSTVCLHSCSLHDDPVRKTPRELFDSADVSLATEINTELADKEVSDEADRTEMEILEDVFYIR